MTSISFIVSIFIIFLLLICKYTGYDVLLPYFTFSSILYLIVAIIICYLFNLFWHDRRWVQSRLVTEITRHKDRAKLAEELTNELKTDRWRREYVQLFLINNVPLTGRWSNDNPNAPRPIFADDALNHDLKELDVQSLKIAEERKRKQEQV